MYLSLMPYEIPLYWKQIQMDVLYVFLVIMSNYRTADWMGDLPEKLHKVPLNQLAIPGKTKYKE